MKTFFINSKNWIVNHFPSRRRIIQLYTFLLYNAHLKGYIQGDIYKGVTKYVCVPGMNCYSCPGAIGACPLGALQNALYSSNTTTAYYMFGIIGLFGLIFARTICGFLCPIGMGQDLLYKIRTPKIGKSKYTRIFSYLKYVLLVGLAVAIPIAYSFLSTATPGFCKYICPAGTFEGGLGLLLNPANWDTTLKTIGPLFTWKFMLLVALIVLGVFMYRPFCRFLCPLGAIYGFFNSFALIGVKLDKNKCTECGLCIAHCKMDVKHVGDHECINCGECIKVCPSKAISWKGSKIFLRENDFESTIPAQDKPLTSIKNIDFKSALPNTTQKGLAVVPSLGSFGNMNAQIVMIEPSSSDEDNNKSESNAAINYSDPDPDKNNDIKTDIKEEESKETKPAKPPRGRSFWMKIAAITSAMVILVGAIVYYNAIYTSIESSHVETGMTVPEFTIDTFDVTEKGKAEPTFNPVNHLGQVIVINFWATWCGPCVNEMPEFNQIANEHPEILVVAIHGNITSPKPETFLKVKVDKNGVKWKDYNILFAQGELTPDGANCTTFSLLGGKTNGYPMTLIVGKDGKITYRYDNSLTYEILKREVEKALAQ